MLPRRRKKREDTENEISRLEGQLKTLKKEVVQKAAEKNNTKELLEALLVRGISGVL